MSTLTADVPRLDGRCPHKLRASCRLTSTPQCCACADRRPHSSTYPVYIDGVGFVPTGTRWQNYCWDCKEFWNNRPAGSQPALSGRSTSQVASHRPDRAEEPHQSWDEVLDELLAAAEDEDESKPLEDRPLTDLPLETKRRLAMILNAVNTLQSQIGQLLNRFHDNARRDSPILSSMDSLVATSRTLLSDTTILGQQVNDLPRLSSQHSEYTFRSLDPLIHDLNDSLAVAKSSLQTANGALTSLSARHRIITTNLEAAHGSVRSLRECLARTSRQLRTAENFARVFGSREDVMRDNYESPLRVMFSRAYGRYAAARHRLPNGETRVPTPHDPLAALWGVPVPMDQQPPGARGIPTPPPGDAERAMQLLQPTPMSLRRERERDQAEDEGAPRPLGLNTDDARPPPLADEEMRVKLECRVCFTQQSSVALLPCGHLIMCQWCADQVVPVQTADGGVLRQNAVCPLCRRKAKRRVDIYMS